MRKTTPLPPLQYLRECFDHDPNTGQLTWRVRPLNHFNTEAHQRRTNTRLAGAVAGSADSYGYLGVRVNNRVYKAHRVIWYMVHGTDPGSMEVDHIEGNRADNRIHMLRLVNGVEQNRNRKRPSTNSTGVMGVYVIRRTGRYRAQIKVDGKIHHLGVFATLEEATKVRQKAEVEFGFHENHGRVS